MSLSTGSLLFGIFYNNPQTPAIRFYLLIVWDTLLSEYRGLVAPAYIVAWTFNRDIARLSCGSAFAHTFKSPQNMSIRGKQSSALW